MNIKIKIPWISKCILTLVYAGIIYWESSRDTSSVSLPYHTDKIVHFMEFGLLCLMTCWLLSSVRIWTNGIYKIILAVGVTSLYGISDEFHQLFTPNRSVDVFDWMADTIGAVTAGLLWQKITHKLQTKEKVLAMEKSPINM
ncbi:MAG TPA: VanZ family protein [Candidatus Wunengus sp. YC64]|uniref:VanZ family protein n=1 Tax=Candidatus Wunengus sp. YC64 TaxID=3367700 RepID=UPI004025D6E8